ncbi:amidohydrolase family protein [Herbidospora mongoliensis]|uniref:amidohydrolase family protein n=1 Tax=Herbidospora mongoliensis TaxID=688067 RepID=UPI00082C94CE|nr:amidohydrolase family protein [Herbidospora mongoliensis]
MRAVIGVEEHAWTAELRAALLADGGGDAVDRRNSQGEINRRLLDVGAERLAWMDDTGVDTQVLSIASPGTQPLPPQEAVPLARDANDFLADTVRRHPRRFAAFATLPMGDPPAAAAELERAVGRLGLVGAMIFPRARGVFLDRDVFRPVFAAAAELGVPLYLHPAVPPRAIGEDLYGGFDDPTGMLLTTAGWGWHAETGLAALRLILAGTFDRHPGLQIILGHWGEMLVPFADRADLLSRDATYLERRILDYITGNLNVTAGGIFSHRMLRQAVDVLGPDRVMFGADTPFGPAADARAFVDAAPISADDKAKLAHLNAENLLGLPRRVRAASVP